MGSSQSVDADKPQMETETTYETGVQSHEIRFNWKVKNFRDVFENESLINSQRIDFYVGGRLDLPWTLFLHSGETTDDGKWVGIYYQIKDRPLDADPNASLFTKCGISITNAAGETVWERSSKILDAFLPEHKRCGFTKMIKRDSDLTFLVDESLVMSVTFKIFINAGQTEHVTQRKRERESENDDNEDSESDEGQEKKKIKLEVDA